MQLGKKAQSFQTTEAVNAAWVVAKTAVLVNTIVLHISQNGSSPSRSTKQNLNSFQTAQLLYELLRAADFTDGTSQGDRDLETTIYEICQKYRMCFLNARKKLLTFFNYYLFNNLIITAVSTIWQIKSHYFIFKQCWYRTWMAAFWSPSSIDIHESWHCCI